IHPAYLEALSEPYQSSYTAKLLQAGIQKYTDEDQIEFFLISQLLKRYQEKANPKSPPPEKTYIYFLTEETVHTFAEDLFAATTNFHSTSEFEIVCIYEKGLLTVDLVKDFSFIHWFPCEKGETLEALKHIPLIAQGENYYLPLMDEKQSRILLASLLSSLNRLHNTYQKQTETLTSAENQLAKANTHYQNTIHSFSFKVGRAFTALPRKMKSLLKK
ncbi:MAG: hypothetical protein GX786_03575, partial [Clostridiales bacterium]|nr:hypothetical protein [Clostridiales bacterium]